MPHRYSGVFPKRFRSPSIRLIRAMRIGEVAIANRTCRSRRSGFTATSKPDVDIYATGAQASRRLARVPRPKGRGTHKELRSSVASILGCVSRSDPASRAMVRQSPAVRGCRCQGQDAGARSLFRPTGISPGGDSHGGTPTCRSENAPTRNSDAVLFQRLGVLPKKDKAFRALGFVFQE